MLLFFLQHHLVAARPYRFAFHRQLLGSRQQRVHQKQRRARQLAAPQILLGNAGQQRLGGMEGAHGFHQAVAGRLEPCPVDITGLRLRQRYQRRTGRRRNRALGHPGAAPSSPIARSEGRLLHQQRDPRGGILRRQHVQPRRRSRRLSVAPLADPPPPRRRL